MKPTWPATMRRLGTSSALLPLGAALLLLTATCSSVSTAEGPAIATAEVLHSSAEPDDVAQVDPALWTELTAELQRVLKREGTARRTAAAPIGFASRVPDLSFHSAGSNTYFTWSYRQHGDYDLNGDVNVSDLTQVGVHFGKTTLDDDWQQAQLADGDGNGEVNVSDVTPIGQNFGGRVDGYELQSRPDPASAFSMVEEYAFLPGDKLTGIYPPYSHQAQLVMSGPEYRLLPYVGSGASREYGVESNLLQTAGGASPWPAHRANSFRDGQAPTTGPTSIDEVWEVELVGGVLFNEPIVGDDGTIFVATMGDEDLVNWVPGNGLLYGIHPDGTVWWRFATSRGMLTSPAACRLGRMVVGDLGGTVYCLAPDGKQLWRRQLAGLVYFSSPLVESDGTVYILTHTLSGSVIATSTLYKLTPAGEIDWSRPLNAATYNSPLYNASGQITVVDEDGELYTYGDDGVLAHNFILPSAPAGHYAWGVAFRGLVYVYCSKTDELVLVAEDNSQDWSVGLGETPIAPPSIGNESRILLATRTTGGDQVPRLNKYNTLNEEWDMNVAGDAMSSIAVDSSDVMYYCSFFGTQPTAAVNGMYCVLPDQTTAWFHPTGDQCPFSPVIAAENLVVCLTTEGWNGSGANSALIGIRGS